MNWLKAVGKTLAWPGELWHTREVDTELDLNAASRETLLEIIAGQRAVIADLQRRIGILESRPNRRGSSGMPGNQPASAGESRLGMMEDIDITLLSLVKNRFDWIDHRWLADCGEPWSEGGNSEGRLDSVRRDAYALLQRKYGSGVVKPMKTVKNSPYRFFMSV